MTTVRVPTKRTDRVHTGTGASYRPTCILVEPDPSVPTLDVEGGLSIEHRAAVWVDFQPVDNPYTSKKYVSLDPDTALALGMALVESATALIAERIAESAVTSAVMTVRRVS